jgi:AcrR family transcriptional regulator
MRGERNRTLIVDALIELIREGVPFPTAEQVAARARVGTRTVFRHFDDMEGLRRAVSERLTEEVRPILEDPPLSGDLGYRVGELVRRRARAFERIEPIRRRRSRQGARSPANQESLARFNALLRRQIDETFAPEIERGGPDLREALDLVLSYESWERLRIGQGVGRSRTVSLLEEIATRLAVAWGA